MSEPRKLSQMHLDALRELGNIGAGNAATALSQIVEQTVAISVPEVSIIPLEQIPELIGPERYVYIVYSGVLGDISGTMLFLITEESATELIGILNKDSDRGIDISTDVARSALTEVGNILCGSYLNALTQMLGILLVPSVPDLANDMAGAILDFILIEIGEVSEEVVFIKTELFVANQKLDGHMFFLPNPGALDVILKSMGLLA
ncbi:MAG: chemotaxis protein CheC [bacterium]